MMLRAEKDNVNREDRCARLHGTAVGWRDALKGGRVSTGNALRTKSWVLESEWTFFVAAAGFRDRVSL